MRQVGRVPRPGDVSGDVTLLQMALNEKGASPQLVEDGDFGPKTKTAVSVFQKSVGLTGTGVPGEKTMAKLEIEILDVLTTGTVIGGSDPDEGTPPWYRRAFVLCEVDPGKESQLKYTVNLIDRGMSRYLGVSKRLGFTG